MIVTVTPNGSVDTVLRRVGQPGEEEQQVLPVAQTAGGKGHNVARFLAAADQEVIACGFVGGWAGREMDALLQEAGVSPRLTPTAQPTRRYLTCLGEGQPRQSLHAPGPTVTTGECRQLVADVVAVARGAAAVVLAGSLPPGAPADLVVAIIRDVAPVPLVLDTSGAALAAGVAARPRMVKVNASEARASWPRRPSGTERWSRTGPRPGGQRFEGWLEARVSRPGGSRSACVARSAWWMASLSRSARRPFEWSTPQAPATPFWPACFSPSLTGPTSRQRPFGRPPWPPLSARVRRLCRRTRHAWRRSWPAW